MNRTFLYNILRCFIRGQQEDWDLHMATVCMAIRSSFKSPMLWREVLQSINLMLHPRREEDRGTPVTYAARHQESMLIERPGRNYSNFNNARRGTMIYVWKKETVYRFNRSIVLR